MTDTVAFWQGDFGDDYLARNPVTAERVERSSRLWSDILAATEPGSLGPIRSVMEVGASAGANLLALAQFVPKARFFGVEPNHAARAQLVRSGVVDELDAYRGLGDAIGTVDLIFTCGVMIHVPPDDLLGFCRRIHEHAGRYIACIEYFAQEPEEKVYRGHAGKLWKRDFGSFWLDNFPDLVPLGCGFAWKRMTGLDDLTWWLFERKVAA